MLKNIAIDITPLKISRDYRLLFFGQLISFFGTMLTIVVVPYQLFQLTQSNLYVGLLGLAEFVPMFILAFVGGAMADALDRRKLLRITEILQTATAIILLINSLLPHPQIWLLYLCVALHAGFAGIQRPAFEALLQKIVPAEYMTSVMALNSLRWSFGAIFSFVLSGFIVSNFSLTAAYFIDVITFAATLIAVFMIKASPAPENAERPSLKTVLEGLRYAKSRQELIGTYLIDINAMLFGMPKALFPALAMVYGGSSIGFFHAAFAVGAFLASMTSGWTKYVYRHGLYITVAAALWGVAIIFFGLSPNLWVGLIFLGAAGFFDMISGIFRGTIWNQTIPNNLRGRLASIEMISYLTGPMLGDAEAGIMAHFFDVKTSIISGGVLCVLGTILLAVLLPKFITYDGREGAKLKEIGEQQLTKI